MIRPTIRYDQIRADAGGTDQGPGEKKAGKVAYSSMLSVLRLLRQPEQCVLKKAGEVDVSCFSVGVQPGRDCDVLADSLLSMRV